ncbi:hypothetical protein ACSFXN_16110 [Planococcus sp. 1R117A]|uniref:hypothetical protein n=1 Tax=Planococcus sp. 1R117A TaxID=3447020 RepID=UPI003EDBA29C
MKKTKGFHLFQKFEVLTMGGAIIGFIFEILLGLAEGFVEAALYFYTPSSKFEKNIERLKKVEWFAEFEDDFRYNYIIWHDRNVKRFLVRSKNVDLLLNDEKERLHFIELVKSKHLKFISRP